MIATTLYFEIMTKIVPQSRPAQSREKTLDILRAHSVTDAVAVLGVRGYYDDTMGKPGKNDRGIYDDAMFIVSPRFYLAVNANTDPSRYGVNQKIGKGMAVLQAGVWRYKRGLHGVSRGNPYPAFVQARAVELLRDGGERERGFFAINIHKGSFNSTSSEGCQTVYPTQWDEFQQALYRELDYYKQATFPYLLIENA